MTTAGLSVPRSVSALAWLPGVAFALAATWLLANWSSVPASWPVHYGASGQPDGWAQKSIGMGFAPLLIGAFVWVLLEVVGVVVLKHRAQDPRVAPVSVAGITLVRLVTSSIAILCASLGVSMPFVTDLGLWFALPFAGVYVAAGIGIFGIHRAVKRVREAHPDAIRGYNAIYYYNKEDDRLWVPKILGVGYTINFAHRQGKLTMALLLGVPLTMGAIGLVSAILAAR